MKRISGIFSAIGGVVLSIVGIIGTTCIVCSPICGTIGIAGPVVAILGVGMAGFLYKYSVIFIVVGVLFFLLGIFLIIRKRKVICCSTSNNEIKKNQTGG